MTSIYVKYVSTLPPEAERESKYLYYNLENKCYYRGTEKDPLDSDIKKINGASLNLSGVDSEGNEIDDRHIYFFEKTKKYYITSYQKVEWLFVSFFSNEDSNSSSGSGSSPIITEGTSFYIIEFNPEEFKVLSDLEEITSAKDFNQQLLFDNIIVKVDEEYEPDYNGGIRLYGVDGPNNYYIITIQSDGLYTLEKKELQKKDEMVTQIADDHSSQLKMYPSVGAMIDYIENNGGLGGGGGSGSNYSVRIGQITPDQISVPFSEETEVFIEFKFEEFFNGQSTGSGGKLSVEYTIQGEQPKIDEEMQNISIIQGTNENPNRVPINKYLIGGKKTTVKISVTGNESKITKTAEYIVDAVELVAQITNKPTIENTFQKEKVEISRWREGAGFKKQDFFEISNLNGESQFVINDFNNKTDGPQTILLNCQEEGLKTGKYFINYWFELETGEKSNTDTCFLFYKESDEVVTTPMVLAENLTPIINYGEQIKLRVVAMFDNKETGFVVFKIKDKNNDLISEFSREVTRGVETEITIEDYPYDNYCLIEIFIKDYEDESKVSYSTELILGENDFPLTQVTNGLIYSFNPNSGSNENETLYSFIDRNGNERKIKSEFRNFNWKSNGFNNKGCLTLTGDAKYLINLPFFSKYFTDADGNRAELSYISESGRAFEIDLDIEHYLDDNTAIVKYIHNDTEGNFKNGFIITPSYCYITFAGTGIPELYQYDYQNKKILTDFIINEDAVAMAYLPKYQTLEANQSRNKMRISFVIEKVGKNKYTLNNNTTLINCINIYINGECVNSIPYEGNSGNINETALIEIGDASAITKVYDVKIYDKELNDTEIKQNYFNSFSTIKERIENYNKNDILFQSIPQIDRREYGIDYYDIDYSKAVKFFPCLLVTGDLIDTPDVKAYAGVTLTKPDTTVVQGYKTEFDCNDIVNGKYVSENKIQGTSSKEYPTRNYKFYLKKNTLEGIKKVKYALKGIDENGLELSYPESTLCWKADFMSTDHANTYNANLADEVVKSYNYNDDDPKKQNTVYGFRCLLFHRVDQFSEPKFYGDGCLNNDKSNTASFGLETEGDSGNVTKKQKWEFRNNTHLICKFQSDDFNHIDDNGETAVYNALESTYPDQGDLEDEKLLPEYKYIQNAFTWVVQRANFWTEENEDNRNIKKEIFKNEFEKHFDLNRALVYYLFIQFIGLVDNRAKNMFLRCEDVTKEEIKYLDNGDIDWENSEFAIWYTDLYDLDSCYGVENKGYMRIPYFADWNFTLGNINPVAAADSWFWCMFEEAFANEIKTAAQEICKTGNSFSLTNIKKQIRDNQNFINQSLSNRDMTRKYHDPWLKGFVDYSTSDQGVNKRISGFKYLHRGSRRFQKESFVDKRYNLYGSFYEVPQFTVENRTIDMRSNGGYCEFNIVPIQFLYPKIAFGQNNWVGKGLIPPGETAYFSYTGLGESDQIQIAASDLISEIGDLEKANIYSIEFKGYSPLKKLIINQDLNILEPRIKTITSLPFCPLLEEIIMYNSEASSLDVSQNFLLKKIEAQGSKLTSVTFPEGGVLNTLHLGSNMQVLNIKNQDKLTDFTMENTNQIAELIVENTIPPTGKQWLQIASENAKILTGLRLVGFNEQYSDGTLFENLITEEFGTRGLYIGADGSRGSGYPYLNGTVTFDELSRTQEENINRCYNEPWSGNSESGPLKFSVRNNNYVNYLKFYLPVFDENSNLKDYTIVYQKVSEIVGEGYDPIANGDFKTPQKPRTQEFTFWFEGWSTIEGDTNIDEDYLKVPQGQDKALYPVFSKEKNKYTVIFKTEYGDILKEEKYEYGTDLLGINAVPNTNKDSNDYRYYYQFREWDKPITIVTDNVTYIAKYDIVDSYYTISWYNGNNQLLYSESLIYDTIPSFDVNKSSTGNPTKASTVSTVYTWTKEWDKPFEKLTKDISFYPVFSDAIRQYEISWILGDQVQKTLCPYGGTPGENGVPGSPYTIGQSYQINNTLFTVSKIPTIQPLTQNSVSELTLSYNINATGICVFNINQGSLQGSSGNVLSCYGLTGLSETIIDKMTINSFFVNFAGKYEYISGGSNPSLIFWGASFSEISNNKPVFTTIAESNSQPARYDWSDTSGSDIITTYNSGNGLYVDPNPEDDSDGYLYRQGFSSETSTERQLPKAKNYYNTLDGKETLKNYGFAFMVRYYNSKILQFEVTLNIAI